MRTSSEGMDSNTHVRRSAWASGFPGVRIIGGSALLALILLLSTAVAKADIYTFTLTSTSPTGYSGTGSVTVDPSQCSGGVCYLPADNYSTGITAFTFTFGGQTFTNLNTCNNNPSTCSESSGRYVDLTLPPPSPLILADLALAPSGDTELALYSTGNNGFFEYQIFDDPSSIIDGTYAGVLATPEPNEIVPVLLMVAILGFFLLRRKLREGSSSRRTPGPAVQL